MSLYTKALKLADEVVIRRELAAIAVESEGCPLTIRTLEGVAPERRTDADRALLETCRRYQAEPVLSGPAQGEHVRALLAILALRDAGVPLQAIAQLDTLATRSASGLKALRADLLHAAGRCDDYVAEVDAMSEPLRQKVSEVSQRVAECRQPAQEVAAEIAAVTEQRPSPPGDAPGLATTLTLAQTDTWAWTSLGSGAALMVAGGAFTAMWLDAKGRHEDAQARYSTGSADEAVAAAAEMARVDDEGALYSGLALGLGLTGTVALTLGVIFLVAGAEAPVTREPATAALYPMVGPDRFGLYGRF